MQICQKKKLHFPLELYHTNMHKIYIFSVYNILMYYSMIYNLTNEP